MRVLGFNEHVNNAIQGKCPFCYEIVVHSDFKDELSKREFEISGLCAQCQIDVFTEDLEEYEYWGEFRVPDEDHYYPDEL